MRLLAALLAVLSMLAGPVAAAGLQADCAPVHAATAASQTQVAPPCPMHAMAHAVAPPSKVTHAAKPSGFSCAQLCAMAGAAVVQPHGSSLIARATTGVVDYAVAPDPVVPNRTPPGFDHPPKTV